MWVWVWILRTCDVGYIEQASEGGGWMFRCVLLFGDGICEAGIPRGANQDKWEWRVGEGVCICVYVSGPALSGHGARVCHVG